MKFQSIAGLLLTIASVANAQSQAHAQGDAARGQEAFRQCSACHSLEPGRHLTGPSLAGVVGRKAGSLADFRRYSPALRSSGLTWTTELLDRWIQAPHKVMPGTSMRMRPVTNPAVRRHLIAFLETVGSQPVTTGDAGPRPGGMPNLKRVAAEQRVTAINYCPDAYQVTVASGAVHTFWEFNLRFKTDSTANGPGKGQPAIVGQGMQGDRAQIVFFEPDEISTFITRACPDG